MSDLQRYLKDMLVPHLVMFTYKFSSEEIVPLYDDKSCIKISVELVVIYHG